MAEAQFQAETSRRGEWVRQANRFTDRITADGASGWPVEPGRYRLVVSLACPWAHRSVIVRRLLGLEDVLSLGVVVASLVVAALFSARAEKREEAEREAEPAAARGARAGEVPESV